MLIFLCPAVLDAVVFLVLFAISYGAGERGMSMMQCAWLSGIVQLMYMAASPAAGLALSRRNARGLLVAGTVLSIVDAVICLLLQSFWPLLVALGVFGVVTALFFNAFQTFMRGEAPPGGLARASALYTLAWSTGSSAGFLLSGALYRLGPLPLALLTCAVGVLVAVMLLRHKSRPQDTGSADEHVEPAHDGAEVDHASYVWVAWLIVFTAMFTQRPIQTFYPAISAQQGVAPALAGLPLFLHMLAQGISGLLMLRLRHLLYRRWALLVVQGAAVFLLLCLWLIPGYVFSAIAISMLGAWAGFSYFCAVYYASNSGRRSRNIGVNEFLVGLGSFCGLFVSQWFMKQVGSDAVMYAVCAGAILVSATLQWLVAGRRAGSRQYSVDSVQ